MHSIHTCILSKCKSPTALLPLWTLLIDLVYLWLSESDFSYFFFADMMVIMLIKMLLSAFSVYPVMSGEATVDRFSGAQLEVKKKCKCIWNKEKASNPINCNWERWLALIKFSITRTMVINYIKTFTNREADRHFFLTRKHPQVQKCNYYF